MVGKLYVVSEKLKIGAEVWSTGDECPKRVILILSDFSMFCVFFELMCYFLFFVF